MNIGKGLIWESNDVKPLGVTNDRDLKFDQHVLKLCSKANQKLNEHLRTTAPKVSIKFKS